MAQQRDELFSALVDNQHPLDDHWLEDLKSDPQVQERWQRYHLIGDAMRGDLPGEMAFDITSKVAAALAEEPAILAPQAVAKPKGVQGFWRPVAQLAIAASVALVAIVGVQQYSTQDDLPQPSSPVLSTLPAIGTAAPVSLEAAGPRAGQQQGRLVQAEQQRRVNAYLQDHAQQLRLQDDENGEDNEANPQ
ncbi:sigma-E factor negative regulatory protein [Gallaecimonas xiamenensis]|uniref:Anti-sigma-E factor RseA n=1 Tax=Gallaecimonas xiamenensis 3-C-1 TaxID=745411 RepID=K2JBD8_9GAMM|nr:RseA family anti-sigma factor [Gallaecimonas xiamenensis]EKE67919.1 anti sigma-E protein RseA [Gallaecimonas xiamenensis 3-C-1]